MICLKKHLESRQNQINVANRSRLQVADITIISSNCLGGFIYHWLGLEFRSPFINLFLTPADFIRALENFDDFMNCDIEELFDYKDDDGGLFPYPIGMGYENTIIHFMHYQSFEEAISAWNRRKERMERTFIHGKWHYYTEKVGVMLSNYSGVGGYPLLERFDKLLFPHKVVFTAKKYPKIKSAVYLKGLRQFSLFYKLKHQVLNIWLTKNFFTGRRFIDQFDYVKWLNEIAGK